MGILCLQDARTGSEKGQTGGLRPPTGRRPVPRALRPRRAATQAAEKQEAEGQETRGAGFGDDRHRHKFCVDGVGVHRVVGSFDRIVVIDDPLFANVGEGFIIWQIAAAIGDPWPRLRVPV